MKPSEILNAAADLITPEGAWGQGNFVKRVNGKNCYCAVGAIEAMPSGASRNLRTACEAVYAIIKAPSITGWNDHPDRTQAEVIDALRKAAKLAQEAGE